MRKIRPWPMCAGHNAVLGCTVEDDWLIGMGSPRVAAILARFSPAHR